MKSCCNWKWNLKCWEMALRKWLATGAYNTQAICRQLSTIYWLILLFTRLEGTQKSNAYLAGTLIYKSHCSRQLNCWSLRCSWSIAYRHCSNYIFILHLILGSNILHKSNYKSRREIFKLWGLVHLILESLWYIYNESHGTLLSSLYVASLFQLYVA